ncbi:hypothetical protein JB92DRAFT_2892412, partial [Gautieria morchelliformis]
MSHVQSAHDMARMVKLLGKKMNGTMVNPVIPTLRVISGDEQDEKAMEIFHANLLEWQDRALAIQERTATTLLDILREALL